MQGGGLALFVWMAMCLFESAIFEVDTSLRWMPWQSKLMSATCITKPKKSNCQVLGYMRSSGWDGDPIMELVPL